MKMKYGRHLTDFRAAFFDIGNTCFNQVNDGTIEDAKTIIAIQYANLYLVWGKGAKQ